MRYCIKAFRNYTNIHGRANRKEYWIFRLVHYVLLLMAVTVDVFFGFRPSAIPMNYGYLTIVYAIVTACPLGCLQARRLHDVGKSGAWYFASSVPIFNFYVLYLTLRAGDPGVNEYGAPPSEENDETNDWNSGRETQSVPQKQFCSRCGYELLEGSSFCSRCGERVNLPTSRTTQHMDWESSEKPRKKWWISMAIFFAIAIAVAVGVYYLDQEFSGVFGNTLNQETLNPPEVPETPPEPEPQPAPEVPKPEPEPTPKPEPETPPALPEQPAEQESEETAFTFLRDWILENYNVELPKDDGSDKSYTETAAEENVEYIFRIIYAEDYDEICLFYVNRYPVSDAMFLSLLWLKPSDTVYLAEWFNYDTANIDEAKEAFWGYCDLPAVSLTEKALVFDGFEGEVEDGDVELYQSVAQEMCLESVYFLDYVLQNASADAGKSYSAEDFGFHLEYSE